MNILIIGNGFDLAHGLPTKYSDFLQFVKIAVRLEIFSGNSIKFLETSPFDKLNSEIQAFFTSKYLGSPKDGDVKDIFKKNPDSHIKKIIQLGKSNLWFKYFESADTFISDGWIDFEKEISDIVKCVDKLFEDNLRRNEITEEIGSNSKMEIMIKQFESIKQKTEFAYRLGKAATIKDLKNSLKELKKMMLDDLNNLIQCLELYIEICIKQINIKSYSPNIASKEVHKLLSFNYTDTFNRVYGNLRDDIEIDYDFIHGKSNIESSVENNMVIGIDEYLSDSEKSINTEFIEFKKYYQRIHKKTGCIYKNWLSSMSSEQNNNLYIFGHSLDITDGDILRELINHPSIKTTIYYLDSDAYGKQIANLVKVLGQDELIKGVYGDSPKLRFVKQEEFLPIEQLKADFA